MDLKRSDLDLFFPQKKLAESYYYHDSLPFLKIEPVPIFFPKNMI